MGIRRLKPPRRPPGAIRSSPGLAYGLSEIEHSIDDEIVIEPHTGTTIVLKHDRSDNEEQNRMARRISARRHKLELRDRGPLRGFKVVPAMDPPYSHGVEGVDYVVEGSPHYWRLIDSDNQKALRMFAVGWALGLVSVTVFGTLYAIGLDWATASIVEHLTLTAWTVNILGFAFGPAMYGIKSARTERRGPG